MQITKVIKILGVIASSLFISGTISANAAEDYRRNEDYIHDDQYGNAYCVVNNEYQTGKFSLQPNYILGDVQGDGIVNAFDAAVILSAASTSGSSEATAEEILSDISDDLENEEQALFHADIDGNNKIDATDAARILSYAAATGTTADMKPLGFAYYYADEEGILQTGFIRDSVTGEVYYANEETYQLHTGVLKMNGIEYYFNEEGVLQEASSSIFESVEESVGWTTDEVGQTCYLDPDGSKHIGWLEYDGQLYRFDEEGVLIVNQEASNGTYDENGVFTKTEYDIPEDVRTMLDHAERTPGIRSIEVKDRQHNILYEHEFTFTLSDRDYEIIEEFAAEHFSPDMTLSECLYETWWWIHCNVIYARGDLWNQICNKSYVDAIFNYQMGQCVQYNGAIAAVLAYYGYDVYMVKGWTKPDFNNWTNSSKQHYWTEVMIDGTRYYVETGNRDSNGDYWQYFFVDAETVNYTKTI